MAVNNINLSSYTSKVASSTCSHTEWNTLFTLIQDKINEIIQNLGSGGSLNEDQSKFLNEFIPFILFSYNDDGSLKNLQIQSPKNINLEPNKGVKVKPGASGQMELLSDKTGDLREVVLKAWRSVANDPADTTGKKPLVDDAGNYTDLADEILVRLKAYCTELEINSYDKVEKNRKNAKIKFKNKDAWQKGVIEGASHDIRAYSIGDGTGGGIALQIAGRDSDGHENKLKIETDRTIDVEGNATASNHSGEGGKGIEIGTINSQMTSLYTKTYRFKADAPIYAVTRGALVTANGKTDYPTQPDDSKDILPTDSCTWAEIVAAVKYLKSQGKI